jgi:DNA helicase II / ATP-dependent DNA helicase PcrA
VAAAAGAGHRNICCVGDDDQSIYSWRGAEVGNILRFEQDFPGAEIIRLEHNYRSTPHILAAASGLIAHNRRAPGKTLRTDDAGRREGRVVASGTARRRPGSSGEEMQALHAKGHRRGEMAVLVRAGFQTRAFEERLLVVGIPYRVIGGLRFYERQEIRDAIAYLRVVAQPDDDLAFERIVNTPKRGLGDGDVAQRAHAGAGGRPAADHGGGGSARDRRAEAAGAAGAGRLLADFARWREQLARLPHAELARQILDESGYTAMWQKDRSPEAPGRLENLKELVRRWRSSTASPASSSMSAW